MALISIKLWGWQGVAKPKFVVCYGHAMKKRHWSRFLRHLIIAAAVAFFIAVLPLPAWTPGWFLYWQVPATIFVFIVYMGKVLIDTILFPKR